MAESTPTDSDGGAGTRGSLRSWTKILLAAVSLVVVVLGIWLALLSSTWDTKVTGLSDGALTPSAVSDGAIRIRSDSAERISVRIDGRKAPVRVKNGSVIVVPEHVTEGRHELVVRAPSAAAALATNTIAREFTVDGTAPELRTDRTVRAGSFTAPVTISGTARGASRVTVGGAAAKLDGSGRFHARVQRPPATIPVVAVDEAGNRSTVDIAVTVAHPGMRAVHMTGLAWSSDELREPILRMARKGLIDTVELDIKDESGEIQYDSQVPLANRIGADKGYYDARKAIEKLHGMGVRVVGRLVAFKDPVLAEASWKSGNRQRVVRTPGGGPYNGGYGDYAFTNFADPVVRQYNIDIAAEAAKLGFDDILYDYVRRPDGNIDSMRFPGLTTTPSKSIAGFLKKTREQVREHGAFLGACVFGITVTRPESVGQNIPLMAEHLDYVAPMIYPSHWGPGEYGVADPNRQPYQIVRRSLKDWQDAVKGTSTQVIPWLQDFSLGATYGPREVAAQIAATRDNGIDSFLLWSPSCRYHAAALKPRG